MKILTPEEVAQKIKLFNEYLEKEKKLQEEILDLRLWGCRDAYRDNQKRHDEILKEIEEIRAKGMMPILEELLEFIAECQKREKEEQESHEG